MSNSDALFCNVKDKIYLLGGEALIICDNPCQNCTCALLLTQVSSVTFAGFGTAPAPCKLRDYAVAGEEGGQKAADSWHPMSLSGVELTGVDPKSLAWLQPASPAWLNPADCIDMDCDGPRVRAQA